jgi:flagellar protein FlaJ
MIYYSIPLSLTIGTAVMILTGVINIFTGAVTYDKSFIARVVITFDTYLILFSLPPAIAYLIVARRHRGIGIALANFLRDLTEVRKTGLSPEKSIESVAARDYGPLNPVVRRMATSLRLGLSIEEAVRGAVRDIKDWIVLATMRFLVDSIELGGGSPDVLETLARFAHGLVTLEEELKKKLRLYVFMPYLGPYWWLARAY